MYSNNVNLNSQVYVAGVENTQQKAPAQDLAGDAQNYPEISSEDELVEYNEADEEQDKVDILLVEYMREMQTYFRHQADLIELQKQQIEIQSKIANAKNEDEAARLQELAENIGARISKINSYMQTSDSRMNDINAQIIAATCDNTEVLAYDSAQNGNLSASVSHSGVRNTQSSGESFNVQNVQYTGNSIPKDLAARLDTKLGKGFSQKCEQVAAYVGCNTNDLLAMMYSESGLNPDARNKNSNAIGLIQCIPSTLTRNGYTTEQVANMSAVEQLDVVSDIYMKLKKAAGYGANQKIDGGTLYAINWLPAYAKRNTIVSKGEKYYSKGLDTNKDGSVTKADLAQRLQNKYNEMQKYI